MDLGSIVSKFGESAGFLKLKKSSATTPPLLGDLVRFPYGPFRFRTQLPKGAEYAIYGSTDLRTWTAISQGTASEGPLEYVDSEAFKLSYRFYRLQVGQIFSANVIGFASVTLAPGFSMIANPFTSSLTVSDVFREWPEGTSLHRFDTRLFRLAENTLKQGRWSNALERLQPGEGAIFCNPTSDYKSVSFTGDVLEGQLSVPIPAGFSIRSSLVPQPGNLLEDLKFPIKEGDVIHLFDRERQKYVLHPYENGAWSAGPPILSVGEAFWVAKTEGGNWARSVVIEG